MATKPKLLLAKKKRIIFRRRRRRRRRREELFANSSAFTALDQLPSDKSAQSLRQDAMVQAQQMIGNQRAQRLIKQKNSKPKTKGLSADFTRIKKPDNQVIVGTNGYQTDHLENVGLPSSSKNGHHIDKVQQNGSQKIQRGFWSSIKKGLSKVGKAIAGGISKVAKAVTGGAKKVFNGIKNGAKKLASGVSKVASKIWQGVKKGASGLTKGVKSFAKSAWNGIKQAAAKLGKGAKIVWGKFKTIAGKAANIAKQTAKWIGKKLVRGFKKVGSFVKKGVNTVSKTVKKGLKKAGGFIAKAAKSVSSGIKNIWNKIKGTAKKALGKVKNFAKKYWNKAKSFAKKAAKGVKNFAKGLWSKAKSIAKKVKDKIRETIAPVKRWLIWAKDKVWNGVKWVSKKVWEKTKGVFHRVKRWVTKLPQRLGRLFSHLWEGVKSLKPWSLSWWKSLGKKSTWMDFLTWAGESLVYLLEAAGIGEVYETVMDFIKFNTRPLKGDEIAKAQEVFGSSIDYELVRVDENAVLGPSWNDREYVSFHTINGWGAMDDHTLIHELTHVWQYEEMGAIYMPKAIHAQETGGYEYGGLTELQKRQTDGKGFLSFNLEQQGQILGDYYIGKKDGSISGENLATYEHFVNQVRI